MGTIIEEVETSNHGVELASLVAKEELVVRKPSARQT
jgi:hypothetical protein